jgi:hypothetical protein
VKNPEWIHRAGSAKKKPTKIELLIVNKDSTKSTALTVPAT